MKKTERSQKTEQLNQDKLDCIKMLVHSQEIKSMEVAIPYLPDFATLRIFPAALFPAVFLPVIFFPAALVFLPV